MSTTSYGVRLADHSEWQIIPSPGTDRMVSRAADIMGLGQVTTATARRLFVVAKNEGGGLSQAPPVSGDGWHSLAFGYGTFWFDEKSGDVVFEISPSDEYIKVIRQACTLLYPIIDGAVRAGGLPVHAGLLEREGHGVILTATGNTGKSTCCRRVAPPWHSPGDDFGLIVKAGDRDYRLHPLPTWSNLFNHRQERRWQIEDNYRLSGIFFLEQGVQDAVLPIRQMDAATRLLDRAGETWLNYSKFDPEHFKSASVRLFENACAIARTVPSYLLRASLTGQFWTEIEKAMDGVGNIPEPAGTG